jgi:hypothetical protein
MQRRPLVLGESGFHWTRKHESLYPSLRHSERPLLRKQAKVGKVEHLTPVQAEYYRRCSETATHLACVAGELSLFEEQEGGFLGGRQYRRKDRLEP